jgi:hypothetical protein
MFIPWDWKTVRRVAIFTARAPRTTSWVPDHASAGNQSVKVAP